VICNGNGIHTQISSFLQHLVDPDGTVKETKFGMNVEMNKRRVIFHLLGHGTVDPINFFSYCKASVEYDTVYISHHQAHFQLNVLDQPGTLQAGLLDHPPTLIHFNKL